MTAPHYTSEVDLLQGRHTQDLLNHGRLNNIEGAHIVAGDSIENAENLAASVTLTEHRNEYLLRHVCCLSVS